MVAPTRDPSPEAKSLHAIVERLRLGDQGSVADLFELLTNGAHFFVRRTVGDNPGNAEIVRRVLFKAAQAALEGKIRDGPEMSSYVLTAIRELASNGDDRVRGPAANNFESPQRTHAMSDLLSHLPPRDREVVRRFYALGHSRERICVDLRLREDAFHEILSRVRKLCGRAEAPRAAAHSAGKS